MNDLRLYDRSRVTTDWQCPRKRFWQYEFGGKGLVGQGAHLELFMGSALHDGLAAIARAALNVSRGDSPDVVPSIDDIATAARGIVVEALLKETTGEVDEIDFANEQGALVEGLLRGFYKQVWPNLMRRFPIILHVEEEMRFDHDGLVFMSKPDLVVADAEGNVAYVEYKSTSSKKEGWVNSWATAVQLHSTIKAIKATTGEDVQQVLVQGLYKGFESYGKQSSPFCYAYKRNGNPPFTQDEVQYEYKAGFKRYPVWEMPGGVKAWVEGMPENVLADQFPQVPPIFINMDVVENFFRQRKYREHEIKLAMQILPTVNDESKEEVMQVAFPQRFDQCHPYFGKACSYLKLCHGHVIDPLNEGFAYREPHHALELEQQNDQTEA